MLSAPQNVFIFIDIGVFFVIVVRHLWLSLGCEHGSTWIITVPSIYLHLLLRKKGLNLLVVDFVTPCLTNAHRLHIATVAVSILQVLLRAFHCWRELDTVDLVNDTHGVHFVVLTVLLGSRHCPAGNVLLRGHVVWITSSARGIIVHCRVARALLLRSGLFSSSNWGHAPWSLTVVFYLKF